MRIESLIEDKQQESLFSLKDFTEDELRILQALGMKAMQRKQSNGPEK
jgi:hypothetical protein